MADYRKMYYLLCSAASKAIDASPEEAKQLLRSALQEAEEMYLGTCGEDDAEDKPCS